MDECVLPAHFRDTVSLHRLHILHQKPGILHEDLVAAKWEIPLVTVACYSAGSDFPWSVSRTTLISGGENSTGLHSNKEI